MSLIALILIGCAEPPNTDHTTPVVDATPDDPSEYVYEGEEPPDASLSAAQIGTAIAEFFEVVFDLQGSAPVAVHDELFDAGDDYCPYAYPIDDPAYDHPGLDGALWYGGCTAESGARYEGYGYRLAYRNYEAQAGQFYWGDAVFGQADMVSPSGESFRLGGTAYSLSIEVPAEQYTSWLNLIEGSFSWEGQSGLETWLSGGLSPALTMQAFYSELYQGNLLILDGGVTGFDGPVDTVVLEGLTFISETLGNDCPQEPGGVLSVRDSAGEWYDVLFDGPTEFGDLVDPAACDGCGIVTYRGEVVGSACADLSHVLDWTSRPW
jgi:hypothetical protein